MTKTRYFIEQHLLTGREVPSISQCSVNYHFNEIAPNLIFGVVRLTTEQLNTIWDNSNIFVFPSIQDRRPLDYWIAQQKTQFQFSDVLRTKFGVDIATDCGRDALIKITDQLDHALFELEY